MAQMTVCRRLGLFFNVAVCSQFPGFLCPLPGCFGGGGGRTHDLYINSS